MTRSLPLVVCAVFLLSAHAAAAKPRVAILRIEGDASGELRDAVSEALGGRDLTLVASKDVNRAADKVGEPAAFTELELRALAIELAADAVIAGKLDKAGAIKKLKLRLYIGKQMAKGFTVSFKDPTSDKFRSMLHDKVLDRIANAGLGEASDARPVKKAKADDEQATDDAEPDPAPASPGKTVAAAPAGAQTRAAPEPPAAPARRPNPPIARVALGASLVDRSYTFDARNIVGKPNNYAGSAPGVRFEAEVYPMAYTNPSGALAPVGIAIAYDQSFGLTAPTLATGTTVPVKQRSYAVGLRYRWAIGAAPAPPTLTFGLGFGKRLFSPDRSGGDRQRPARLAEHELRAGRPRRDLPAAGHRADRRRARRPRPDRARFRRDPEQQLVRPGYRVRRRGPGRGRDPGDPPVRGPAGRRVHADRLRVHGDRCAVG